MKRGLVIGKRQPSVILTRLAAPSGFPIMPRNCARRSFTRPTRRDAARARKPVHQFMSPDILFVTDSSHSRIPKTVERLELLICQLYPVRKLWTNPAPSRVSAGFCPVTGDSSAARNRSGPGGNHSPLASNGWLPAGSRCRAASSHRPPSGDGCPRARNHCRAASNHSWLAKNRCYPAVNGSMPP